MDYDDLMDLGFFPENSPGEGDGSADDWFALGAVRVVIAVGGHTTVYAFTDDRRRTLRAAVEIDGDLPSAAYRQIVESVLNSSRD